MSKLLHPDSVLHENPGGVFQSVDIPVCEHYAGDEKKLRKALALQDELEGAFDVTADLEDGAASGQEAHMVRRLAAILAETRPTVHRLGCRVHPADHPSFADDVRTLLTVKPAGLAYLTIPKVAGISQLESAAAFIKEEAIHAGWASPPALQVILEDEAGIHHSHAIAAHSMVRFISFGQMDFTSSHHGAIPASAMQSPGQFDHPLMRRAKLEISAACHAHGKIPTHNPTIDYGSATQAFLDAARAKGEFGFLRMWSIHPHQVRQILSAFAPSQAEIEDATRILLSAQAASWGPIADQGLLHDRASYRYFWTLLKRARSAGVEIPAAAEQAFF
jgi:citrate lyase subunit beta/citryl-CoA lyase